MQESNHTTAIGQLARWLRVVLVVTDWNALQEAAQKIAPGIQNQQEILMFYMYNDV